MAIDLTSAAFGGGEAIASRYTCDGPGSFPPLSWGSVPNGTLVHGSVWRYPFQALR